WDRRPRPASWPSRRGSGRRPVSFRETLRQRADRRVMGEIDLQRSHGDKPLVDRFEIRSPIERLLDILEPEPVVLAATRVDALDHGAARIIVETLPYHADSLHFFGRKRGEV